MGKRDHALVRYLWAFPATVVGLILAVIALVLGGRARLVDGILEVGGGRLNVLLARVPGSLRIGAVTFGHVIVGVDRAELDRSRAHEQVHVRQYERWGILFFPLYLGSSLNLLLRGRSPYWENRFEREARRESAEARTAT
ncbi:MAG: hypothetical protein ACRDFZ_06490 [Candidatus Limnocylindria bacterium]